jgi:hypothetical protein
MPTREMVRYTRWLDFKTENVMLLLEVISPEGILHQLIG